MIFFVCTDLLQGLSTLIPKVWNLRVLPWSHGKCVSSFTTRRGCVHTIIIPDNVATLDAAEYSRYIFCLPFTPIPSRRILNTSRLNFTPRYARQCTSPWPMDMLAIRPNIERGFTYHGVSCLHKDGTRPGELAHKAFTSCQVADNPARRNTFQRVFAVPRDEMSVVDDVFLAFAELVIMKRSVMCSEFWHE